MPANLIAAALAGDQNLIVIGRGRSIPGNSRKNESPGLVAFSQWAIDHLKNEGGCSVDKAGLNSAWDTLPANVKHTHNLFQYMFKKKQTVGGLGLTMDLLYTKFEEQCIQTQHGNVQVAIVVVASTFFQAPAANSSTEARSGSLLLWRCRGAQRLCILPSYSALCCSCSGCSSWANKQAECKAHGCSVPLLQQTRAQLVGHCLQPRVQPRCCANAWARTRHRVELQFATARRATSSAQNQAFTLAGGRQRQRRQAGRQAGKGSRRARSGGWLCRLRAGGTLLCAAALVGRTSTGKVQAAAARGFGWPASSN
jgi:hypothetical protein